MRKFCKEGPRGSGWAARLGDSHGGQGDECGEGSRGDGGDPIVIERQQSHRA